MAELPAPGAYVCKCGNTFTVSAARAERAEAELANARELRNILTGHLADANDRAQRAEATIQRVRELHTAVAITPGHPHGFVRGDRLVCRSCEPERGGLTDAWPCPTTAALDSTDQPREVREEWRAGYDAAVDEMRGVVGRTGSWAARWAADYLAAQRKYVEGRDSTDPVEAAPEDEAAYARTMAYAEQQINASQPPIPYLFGTPYGVTADWRKAAMYQAATHRPQCRCSVCEQIQAELDGTHPDVPTRSGGDADRPNAEDCPRCDPDQMSYPFICPGHPDVPAPRRSGEFAIGDWVLVDVSDVVQQRGQIVNVVPAEGGGVWEYDVRVRDGEIVAAQPAHVHPDYTRSDSGLPVDGETP